MSYTNVFGGELIFPSQLSFLLLTTGVSVQLQWPTEQQITGNNVVADFLNLNATVGGLNIDMPSALIAGTGNKTTINNVGANAFDVRDFTGGALQTIQPGEAWVIVLTDNSTSAGTWTTFQLGASVSVASASALAGAGIKAIATTLNQKINSTVKSTSPFTAISGDRATCLIYTAGAGTCNLTAAGTLGTDWFFMLRNSGSGTLNVLPPAGTIDGSASINLDPSDSCFIFTDGTDFFTVGLSAGSSIAFDFVSIPVPGSGDFTLSGANLNRISYRFTGLLTGNRRIVVPNTTQQYWVDNQTTGAFTLSVSTVAQGAPPQVPQGQTVITYCDSISVINASTSTSVSFPITIGQGGTGATTAAAAVANLGAVPTSRTITAGSGLSGGGDLTANRTLALDINSLATDATPDFAADFVPTFDTSAAANKKVLLETIYPVTLKTLQGTNFTFVNQGTDQTITGLTLPLLAAKNYLIEFCVRIFVTSSGYSFSWDPPAGTGLTGFGARAGLATPLSLTSTGATDVIDSQTAAARDAWITGEVYYNPSADGDLIFTVKQATADLNQADVSGSSWSRATIVP